MVEAGLAIGNIVIDCPDPTRGTTMYLVAIAWMYVAVMMAIAEATHSQGSVLGAIITLLLYGVLPLGLVLYIMGTPARRRRRKD